MSTQLEALQSDFTRVSALDQLIALKVKYSLKADGIEQSTSPYILSIIGTVLEGVEVRVTHRWHDPSGPFQNLPDINKVVLEVGGRKFSEIEFED